MSTRLFILQLGRIKEMQTRVALFKQLAILTGRSIYWGLYKKYLAKLNVSYQLEAGKSWIRRKHLKSICNNSRYRQLMGVRSRIKIEIQKQLPERSLLWMK